MIEIINNDCLIALREMADNSVDAVITDPPYELGFMGKAWDKSGIAYNVDMWRECLRVLKPGGHLLAFGGTRTYHRMACAIEDAGFEIRDQIQWIYGSGFPKSLNIGKAVDKLQGNERENVGIKQHAQKDFKDNLYAQDPANRNNSRVFGYGEEQLTKGTSEWEGFGTALKPANEPICLARKPLSEKTIAENVLKWRTGGLNIDGCRVEYNGETPNLGGRINAKMGFKEGGWKVGGRKDNHDGRGRFPANIIHDGSDEVVREFPNSKAGKFKGEGIKSGGIWSESTGNPAGMEYGDDGSTSRFFYCAKASKSERDAGCEGMENKIGGGMKGTEDKTLLTGSGNIRNNIMRNNHPTVKPIALMRYLCRLITPPKGMVLDPFMGSGSTGIACKLEGFSFIGIELEEEYCKIAQARIDARVEDKPAKEIDLTLF